jgi:hypothetical protein
MDINPIDPNADDGVGGNRERTEVAPELVPPKSRAPNQPTYRIWRTGKYGTAAEVIAKWNRGELGPEHDPWNEIDDAGSDA